MTVFTSLHTNTEYSLLESTIKIDSLISFALEKGLESLAITDRNVMFGVAEFVAKCNKNGIKPIIGIDLDVEDYRLILLAKNFYGYQELSKLSSRKQHGEDIALTDISTADIFVIDHPDFGHYAKTKRQLNVSNYFVGTTNEDLPNAVFIKDTKILKKSENKALEILTSIANGGVMPKESYDYEPYLAEGKIESQTIKQAIVIANECNVVFPTIKNMVPKYSSPNNLSSESYFKKLITDGSANLLKDVADKGKYVQRIKHEVSIIEKLGFTDYFLILWDVVAWAKSQDIVVGPGRGSAAGSLVSYLLGITEIDPLKFDLLFERFLNPERISMPDIDIDIQDVRRDEVINYLFQKYGKDNIGLISTFSRLGAKSSLRDSARAMGIQVRDVEAISKAIPMNASLKEAYETSSRFRAAIDKTSEYTVLFNNAMLIEGLPRQRGTHAAGIVISNNPLIESVPTMEGPNGHNQVQFTMDHLEEHGLLKIDLLGLRNLTIIKRIQEEIYTNYKKRVDLKQIPLDDSKTNDLLSRADTNGIFQFESYGMKSTLAKIKVSSLDDVVAILSLYRPGPMEYIDTYAARKAGLKKIKSIDKAYDEIVNQTQGIIIYQEQIMMIAQSYAGMSFAQADILRRAISKKKHSLISSLKEVFFDGATKNGHSNETTEEVFAMIEKFANYGFNKSHAVAYGMLSYRFAFLKARFPFEFYTSLLESSTGSQSAIQKYVNEAKAKKIKIIAPDVNLSQRKVVNENKSIILPLNIIKGFGEVANTKLINERENGKFEDFFDFISRVKNAGIGEPTINQLIQANALREFGNTQTLLDALPMAIRYSSMITIVRDGVKIIDTTIIAKPKLLVQKSNIKSEIAYETKLLGFQLSAFATLEFEKEKKLIDIAKNKSEEVVVFIERIKKMKDKNGSGMARVIVSDSTNRIEITIFASAWKFVENVKTGAIVEALISRKEFNGSDSYNLIKPWKEVQNG